MDPSPSTLAALGAPVVRPPFLVYLDIDGDQVRATTWEVGLTFTDTGDTDLDGHSFSAISREFVNISPVKRQTGGSETVTAELSGIVGPDSDLLNLLGDETKWKGRIARLWYLLLNEDGARIGGVVPYYSTHLPTLRTIANT
jgi:hypothetical protein